MELVVIFDVAKGTAVMVLVSLKSIVIPAKIFEYTNHKHVKLSVFLTTVLKTSSFS